MVVVSKENLFFFQQLKKKSVALSLETQKQEPKMCAARGRTHTPKDDQRCSALGKDGMPCQNWAVTRKAGCVGEKGEKYCWKHGGAYVQGVGCNLSVKDKKEYPAARQKTIDETPNYGLLQHKVYCAEEARQSFVGPDGIPRKKGTEISKWSKTGATRPCFKAADFAEKRREYWQRRKDRIDAFKRSVKSQL